MKVSLEILLPYTQSFWLVMYQLTSSKIAMLLLPYLKLWETLEVALQVVKIALNPSPM